MTGKFLILLMTLSVVIVIIIFSSSRSPVYATHICGQQCAPANTCPHGCQCICTNECTTGSYSTTCPSNCCGGVPPVRSPTPTITPIPTVPINPTLTPTPPAPITSRTNPRGCGILWTSGVPSCWCNNGGGQGLCGSLPIDTCRQRCESGTFTGPAGYTHCFMMTSGAECASNPDGSYKFCLNECMQGNPGYMHTVGCIFPNTTVYGPAVRSGVCDAALANSSNATFQTMIDNLIRGVINYITANNYRLNLVRVPGLQKATCNPFKLECERGFTSF